MRGSGGDHVICDDELWKPPQSGSLNVMLSYWREEVTFLYQVKVHTDVAEHHWP